jgi:hypothetical protein
MGHLTEFCPFSAQSFSAFNLSGSVCEIRFARSIVTINADPPPIKVPEQSATTMARKPEPKTDRLVYRGSQVPQ